MSARAVASALLCLVLVGGACDSESDRKGRDAERDARAVAQKFLAAITSGDAVTACRQFLPRSGEIMFDGPCEPRPNIPMWAKQRFADGEVRSVRVNGATAETVIQNSEIGESGLILKRTEGQWKIFSLSEGSSAGRQDAAAIRQLNATTIAYSGYAAAHGNSFAGADPRDLRKYVRTVPLDAKLSSTRDTFAIEILSESGNVFRIRAESHGGRISRVARDCEVAGVGKCPADGLD